MKRNAGDAVQESQSQHIAVAEVRNWPDDRRQPVPHMATKPALAAGLGTQQPAIELIGAALVFRARQLQRFAARVTIVLGDPVPYATSVVMDQIVGQVAGCTFREELFVDGAALTSALAAATQP